MAFEVRNCYIPYLSGKLLFLRQMKLDNGMSRQTKTKQRNMSPASSGHCYTMYGVS